MNHRLPLLASLLLLPVAPAGAAEKPAVDKRAYSLARPTPDAELRELSSDRPDVTESPFTVDAGRMQLEMDLAAWARSGEGGGRTTELAVAPFNLRVGLTSDLEAGIFFDPYVRRTERPRSGPAQRTQGSGDTVLRVKFNCWGNDGGDTALGLMADVKLPTARSGLGNGKVEGALTLPVAFELGRGWEAGAMTSVAAAYDGDRHRPVWLNTLTAGHALTESVGAYVELTSQAGDGTHVASFDVGLTWRLDRHTQLDAGVNLGISRAAPDTVWFAGLTRRF